MIPRNALQMLSIYDDDDSDEEVPFGRVSTKRVRNHEDDERISKHHKSSRLPLPNIISHTSGINDVHLDSPNEHDGRTRSFPHERGNWSTYLYIPYHNDDGLHLLIKDLITESGLNMKPVDHLHVSLTKTVILKHHWINSFIDTVRTRLGLSKSFGIAFNSVKIYCNEDRTRTFLGINIDVGQDSLMQIVNNLDGCLNEFNLPTFYDNPSFHMSLAWCVGDRESELNYISQELNVVLERFIVLHKDNNWYDFVNRIHCKCGNKFFQFDLN